LTSKNVAQRLQKNKFLVCFWRLHQKGLHIFVGEKLYAKVAQKRIGQVWANSAKTFTPEKICLLQIRFSAEEVVETNHDNFTAGLFEIVHVQKQRNGNADKHLMPPARLSIFKHPVRSKQMALCSWRTYRKSLLAPAVLYKNSIGL